MGAFSWHGRSIAESDHELLLERFAPTRLFARKGAGVQSLRLPGLAACARRRVQAVDWNGRFFMAWAKRRRIRPWIFVGTLRPYTFVCM
jgi:hypothetical protein